MESTRLDVLAMLKLAMDRLALVTWKITLYSAINPLFLCGA